MVNEELPKVRGGGLKEWGATEGGKEDGFRSRYGGENGVSARRKGGRRNRGRWRGGKVCKKVGARHGEERGERKFLCLKGGSEEVLDGEQGDRRWVVFGRRVGTPFG